MKNILIVTGRYLPGYKDGGPVRTIKNLTDMYGDKYHFTVACADRDHGDEKAYEGILVGAENRNTVGKADVVYIENGNFSFSDIKSLATSNDLIYVCGPYNNYAIKTLILNRMSLIKVPVVLAPMGSFSKGALAIRSTKKKIYLMAMKALGLLNKVYFSVTSEVEKEEMEEALKIKIDDKCFIAEDPQRCPVETTSKKLRDENGLLNIVFLSRICEKKNLLGAAEILSLVKEKAVFHIFGNMEDEDYYQKCLTVLEKLPENITWKYMGEADSENVPEILSKYDVFLFPTHGENFGHVISEALLSGVVPVISDTTPWLDLHEKGAGFVLPLGDKQEFVKCIDKLCQMTEKELEELSAGAKKYYLEKYEYAQNNNGYIKIFDSLA